MLIRAYAHSTSANLGAGYDVLAFAHDAYRDIVDIKINPYGKREIKLVSIEGPYRRQVSCKDNTGLKAAELITDEYKVEACIKIRIYKGIPVGLGLGSSGASAAAVTKGLQVGLDLKIPVNELIRVAGYAEAVSAGTPHYDNVAACILGRLIILYSFNPVKIIRYPIETKFILVTPFLHVDGHKTRLMRSILPQTVPLNTMVENIGKALILLLGLIRNNYQEISEGIESSYIDSLRLHYLPEIYEIASELRNSGIKSFSLSGAGPSILIPYRSMYEYNRICETVNKFGKRKGIKINVKVVNPVDGIYTKIVYR